MQLIYTSPIINYLLKTCLIALFSGFNHWSSNVANAQTSPHLPDIRIIFNRVGADVPGVIEQLRQLQNNNGERMPKLPNELDITQRSIILLSCKPGEQKTSNALIIHIHRQIIVQPSEILLAETAIWRDMRLTSTRKHTNLTRIHQKRSKRVQNYEAPPDYPKIMEATKWIKTKDNKILLTGGKPVKRFTGSRLIPDSCHSK